MAQLATSATTAGVRRLLCLHGYTQNATVFRKRTAVLRKDISALCELTFVTAPHRVEVDPPKRPEALGTSSVLERPVGRGDAGRTALQDDPEGPRAWWVASDCGSLYQGLEESLEMLSQVWVSQGPFDGIIGFSQGATMAWLLAGHLHRTARTTKSHSLSPSTNTIGHEASKGPLVTDASSLPVLVMSISGFVPRSDIGLALVNDALLAQVNGLHIIGRSDTWVDPSRSEQLAMMLQSLCPSQPKTVSDLHPVLNSQTAAPLTLQNRELISCEDPSGSAAKSLDYAESNSQCIFFHDGGHFVPTDAVMRQKIRQYLTERFSQK